MTLIENNSNEQRNGSTTGSAEDSSGMQNLTIDRTSYGDVDGVT